MGLFLICLVISCFLTPLAINIFWLIVFAMPFIAIYNHESAGLTATLFFISALLIQGPLRSLYVVGLVGPLIFMVLSEVAVAAFAYVVAHPDHIAIIAAGVLVILLFFIPRKPLVEVKERQPRESDQRLVVNFHPHPSIAQPPGLIAHDDGPPKPSANPP